MNDTEQEVKNVSAPADDSDDLFWELLDELRY